MAKVLVTPRSLCKYGENVVSILEEAGHEVVLNPTGSILTVSQMKERLSDCEGVILGVDPLTTEVLRSAPRLKAIAKFGVGLDNIDLPACIERGIRVSKTIGANTEAVADYTFALMLALSRRILPIDTLCRQDNWQKITTLDIHGRTLGLMGYGAIARAVARRAAGFDMVVMAYDIVWDDADADASRVIRATPDEICRQADFISLHLPLTSETTHLMDERRLSLMKPTAILVNTARGGLVDERALLRMLQENRIYGAGLDVFETEPPTDKAWYGQQNAILGSHCAASTLGAIKRMGHMAAQNLVRDLSIVD